MGTLYAVPEDLWIHAAPPALLFGDADDGIQGIDHGTISTVDLQIGASSGVITARGIPRGTWTVMVRCAVGGEVNDNGTVNPSTTTLPQFEFSNDSGLTWLPPQPVSALRNIAEIKVARLGIIFQFQNGTAPSYVAGSIWQCHTAPSQDIVAMIPTVCARMDKKLIGSYDLPLQQYPPDFTWCACELLRWQLLKKIGVAERQDMSAYKPIDAWDWLTSAQNGEFDEKPGVDGADQLGIKETGHTRVQEFIPQPQPSPLCREFPI